MAEVKGKRTLDAFLASLPAKLETNILRPALRAGAEVIADRQREMCRSEEVRQDIKVSTSAKGGIVTAKVQVKGPHAFIAPWLEFGTTEHFITVDETQREGRTVRRMNRQLREGSLVINGQFVGDTVLHPGAKPYPFFRPGYDAAQGEAVDVIGTRIRAKLTPSGINTPDNGPAEDK